MALPARTPEMVHLRAIVRFHPLFRDADFDIWMGDHEGAFSPATIEGGDVLVIGNGAVLVGMGERTSAQAVELLARRLFEKDAARRVIAVRLPALRKYMHLDTVMTMIDRDAFCIFPSVADQLRSWSLRPDGAGGVRITPEADFFQGIADALKLDRVRIVTTGGDEYQAEREQSVTRCPREARRRPRQRPSRPPRGVTPHRGRGRSGRSSLPDPHEADRRPRRGGEGRATHDRARVELPGGG